ncbi:cytochrome b [Phyllobacterium sp. P30BS-XVII]|uniref:cytochrome b n=1 Tax=Phyllobacterium sp. P30BS-XVII TaxID=2587046 RepID=UPI000DDE2BDD|nr:cytochrome b [Phyllobacterium sp. P30BS-XVII]MBA8903156.1 cytochrome b561 [Phyllobacterium sp. P30BS-XVII]
MASNNYSTSQKSLHWIIFVLVVGLYGLTFGDDIFQRGDPNRAFAWWLHISFGMLLAFLVGWRVFLRLVKGTPEFPLSMTVTERVLARAGHLVLYALLIAIPLLGIFLTWYRGDALSFFGLFTIPAPFLPDRETARSIKELHSLCANGILILASLHALAAFWHHLVRRDNVLKRMLFIWR